MTGTTSEESSSTNVLSPWSSVKPEKLAGVGRVLIFGGGYTGQRFARVLDDLGVPVSLTHRQAEPPAFLSPEHWLRLDAAAGALPGEADLAGTTHVLVTIPPSEAGNDPVLSHLGSLLMRTAPSWVGVLSTTGVYGDHGGRWVDEGSTLQPALGRSRARLLWEQAWRNSGLPVQVFRLPAIYGPGRSPFPALKEGRVRLIHKPGQVFSRIHVDDIVGALLHCLTLPSADRPATLNLADVDPCPSSETLGYAAHLLGCKLPPVERFADVASTMSPMARSFWMENRRTDSRLLREQLGYRLRYPSYREGYREGCSSDWEPACPSLREGMLRS
ncbi:MAG: SDR family NAD(P)-dependent oxidoreductase [Cyanobacteriota bacterium]